MQNDFITGTLGSKLAKEIVSNVVEKVKNFDGKVIFTRDTHFSDYMQTQEGKNLPVEHCIKDTDGWHLNDKVLDADAFAAFEETGDILNPEVAKRYLHLLEQGGTRDAQELYLEFRGKPADPKHLLKKKGF